ncbi:hypothetical protein REIS_0900 [Rickettsia endosymbiont of Ixodes scapularis]|nr:hypothetical protein REIS_0900 [Rickettsia endosymbiont of Ixodes scapularis]
MNQQVNNKPLGLYIAWYFVMQQVPTSLFTPFYIF